jgi:hypothetical protein
VLLATGNGHEGGGLDVHVPVVELERVSDLRPVLAVRSAHGQDPWHPWQLLPIAQLGCGSPVTCGRRLRDWQRARVWQQLHHLLLDELGRQG